VLAFADRQKCRDQEIITFIAIEVTNVGDRFELATSFTFDLSVRLFRSISVGSN
jgi:hypothetical protein